MSISTVGRSVRWSVSWSVGQSIGRTVGWLSRSLERVQCLSIVGLVVKSRFEFTLELIFAGKERGEAEEGERRLMNRNTCENVSKFNYFPFPLSPSTNDEIEGGRGVDGGSLYPDLMRRNLLVRKRKKKKQKI